MPKSNLKKLLQNKLEKMAAADCYFDGERHAVVLSEVEEKLV